MKAQLNILPLKRSRMLPRLALSLASSLAFMGLLQAPLVASAQVPPSAQEVARFSALHAAAHRGNVAAIEAAASAKLDLNARDSYGRTPLHVAVFAKQREAVRALVKAGANINLLENDRYDGITIASVADDEETLRVLIQLGASAKLTTSRYDGTALIAAAHLGHDGVVRQLIAAGAPLDHVNNLHWTAVIESIVLGDGGKRHQATLEALIKAGANLQLKDRAGNTPLALAKQRGYSAMVRVLEAVGAK
jgi:ankyrin repeat protein